MCEILFPKGLYCGLELIRLIALLNEASWLSLEKIRRTSWSFEGKFIFVFRICDALVLPKDTSTDSRIVVHLISLPVDQVSGSLIQGTIGISCGIDGLTIFLNKGLIRKIWGGVVVDRHILNIRFDSN